MTTTVTTDPVQILYEFPFQQVEVSTDITDSDSWVTSTYLWCQELKLAVNAYSTAKLRYEIGNKVLQPGSTTITDYQPLSLRGKYVRIIIAQDAPLDDIEWVGYVLTDAVQRDGVETVAGVQKFKGECQEFHCVGLEWFLDRKQVETSLVSSDNADGFVKINRALKFNGGESSTLDMKAAHRGNRAADTNSDSLYYFSDDPTTEDKWTGTDIVQYLLQYQNPRDKDDEAAPCDYFLDLDDLDVLDGFEPLVVAEHATVFQLLNKVASPQRGMCWWLEFDSDAGNAHIRTASLARAAITLPGGGNFPANANQITLSFDGEVDVKSVDVVNQGKRNYHRVTCRGARQTCTFTVGVYDETLKTDWTTDAEVDYEAAASLDADYSGLSEAKKKDRNDAYRLGDLLTRVYSYFRIPKDWDGKTGDGLEAGKQFAIAEISDTGSRIGGLPLHAPGIRLLNRTRLKSGVDYSDPSSPITSNTPDETLEEFLPPFAFVRVEKDEDDSSDFGSDKNRWQYTEKLHESKFRVGTKVSADIHTNYNLHMQEHVPGIKLRAGGAPNHTLALNHFDPETTAEPSKFKTEVTYDTLRATVCAEADYYASGISEVNPLPAGGVPIEELIVDLGDDYRLDFLAENTIVHIKNGKPQKANGFAILRDDRSALRDFASIALQWYREDRQQLTVEFRQLRNLFSLGELVTTIGEGTTQSTINTAISVITYDFKLGTMRIETMDDALDLRLVAGEARRRGKA